MPLDEASAKRYARKPAFLEWCAKDGLSVISGYGVEDLKFAPLKHWERLAGPAAELERARRRPPARTRRRAAGNPRDLSSGAEKRGDSVPHEADRAAPVED